MYATGRRGIPRAELARLLEVFARPQLHQPVPVETAMGQAAHAIVTALQATNTILAELEDALTGVVDTHPDTPIITSLPALGGTLAGRILGEFGDDPTRFDSAASRRAYAGTAPVTRASGKTRVVVMRRARNLHLVDACRWWAFATLTHSPQARAYYDRCRAGATGTRLPCANSAANWSPSCTTA